MRRVLSVSGIGMPDYKIKIVGTPFAVKSLFHWTLRNKVNVALRGEFKKGVGFVGIINCCFSGEGVLSR